MIRINAFKLAMFLFWAILIFALFGTESKPSRAASPGKTILEVCTTDDYKTFKVIDPLDTGRYFPTQIIRNVVKRCDVIPPPIEPPASGLDCPPMMPCVDMGKLPIPSIGFNELRLKATTERPTASNEDHGAVRVSCDLSAVGKYDPIIYPGQNNVGHLHYFFGNTNVTPNSTTESIRTSGNSTCNGGIMNRTAYWVPGMIDTATNTGLKPRNALEYYKHGKVNPFPRGLVMVAGNKMTDVTDTGTGKVWFECNEQYASRSPYIPACAKGGLVTQHVTFPDCNNGLLDSADHRSHMAYSTNGVCPATHPIHFPTLSQFVYTPVTTDGTSKWKLSSDMYTTPGKQGASSHADFMMGWDEQLHSILVERCINASLDCHAHLTGDGRMYY